jgi:hypothetical protein
VKNRKITYKILADHLRNRIPEPDNPEKMTQEVMAGIERLSRNRKKSTVIRMTGLLSGAAACLLFCFLAAETVNPTVYSMEEARGLSVAPVPPTVADTGRIRDNPADAKKTIMAIFRENRENKARKEQIYTAFLKNMAKKNIFQIPDGLFIEEIHSHGNGSGI